MTKKMSVNDGYQPTMSKLQKGNEERGYQPTSTETSSGNANSNTKPVTPIGGATVYKPKK